MRVENLEVEVRSAVSATEQLNSPFAHNPIREAGRVDFKVFIEKGGDGWYTVTVPALPGCVSQGKTEKQALDNIREAIELHLSSLAADGTPITQSKTAKAATVRV